MERVFRDSRFPNLEIRNSGGPTFNIWIRGGPMRGYHSEGGWTNTDCFTYYADNGSSTVSAAEAEQVAQRHFDEMADEEELEA